MEIGVFVSKFGVLGESQKIIHAKKNLKRRKEELQNLLSESNAGKFYAYKKVEGCAIAF